VERITVVSIVQVSQKDSGINPKHSVVEIRARQGFIQGSGGQVAYGGKRNGKFKHTEQGQRALFFMSGASHQVVDVKQKVGPRFRNGILWKIGIER